MTDCIVVSDTNVMASASILFHIPGSDAVVMHEFYEESRELLASLAEDSGTGTPYLVPTVEEESFPALSKAVNSSIDFSIENDPRLEKIILDNIVRISSLAADALYELLGHMHMEDLDEARITANLRIVEEMSSDLARQREDEVRRGRTTGVGISRQLRRFMKKRSNSWDERILAEMITLMGILGREGRRFVIASHDTSFFSPHILNGDVSDTVTREIFRRFCILCDHPRNVLRICAEAGAPGGR